MSVGKHRPQFLFQCSLGKNSSAPADLAAALQHSGSFPNEQAFIKKKRNKLWMFVKVMCYIYNITKKRFIKC